VQVAYDGEILTKTTTPIWPLPHSSYALRYSGVGFPRASRSVSS
jgi:hypothetical protein